MSIKRLGDALGPLVFPPPPLKFRTAGFPQYGFKRDIRATTFVEFQARLIRGASPSPCPLWPRRACVLLGGGRSPEHSRPEALGSPAGYVVPPRLCLLRPHVPLSAPLSGLFSSSRRVSSRPITTGTAVERFPNLLCVSVLSCRLPYPGGPHGCSRLILRHAHWPSPSWYRLGIHGTTIADSQVGRPMSHESAGEREYFRRDSLNLLSGPQNRVSLPNKVLTSAGLEIECPIVL